MEKLLEVLIAIGDEVACLSVANLILRHWPSHSRALHVKKTIEDAEPVPFAPRGIDKLEPKHVRLKFSEKRKSVDDENSNNHISKRRKQTIELQLAGATWSALLDAILGIFVQPATKDSEPETLHDHEDVRNDKQFNRLGNELSADATTIDDKSMNENMDRFTCIKIDIRLSEFSDIILNPAKSKEHGLYPVGGCTLLGSYGMEKSTTIKERDISTDREHHQERRSTRLEMLRSRKLSKEESESSAKDQANIVCQFLEPFILRRLRTVGQDCPFISDSMYPDSLTYNSNLEHNDTLQFISKTSKNFGAHHIAHLLLEEVAHKYIPFQDSFVKFMELEKLTRNWGQDRSPLSCLFLAELYYDQGSWFSNRSKRLEYLSEASYHLCKVIELVTLDSHDDLIGTNGQEEITSSHKHTAENVVSDCVVTYEENEKHEDAVDTGKNSKLDPSSEQKQSATVGETASSLTDEELEEIELGIDNALDQSFFCLYGLKINPDSSSEEELAIHKNTSRGEYQTKEQCADVFRYVLPYAKALSLRRVLRAIRKHFPQPPDDMLSENAIDKFLDGPDLWEDKLREVSGPNEGQELVTTILSNARGPETHKKSSVVSSEQYLEVYGNLYYLIAQAEEISAIDKYAGFMGQSPAKALSYFSKAASLNPSAVVATHAFSQSTREKIQEMFDWTNQDLMQLNLDGNDVFDQDDTKEKKTIDPKLLDKAWHILYDDCLIALGICVEGELKHFHKARYMLAKGLYRRGEAGDLERAKEELSFCFKSSRSSFTVNMWEIDGMARKGRKSLGLSGNKRSLELSLSESSRKFITCHAEGEDNPSVSSGSVAPPAEESTRSSTPVSSTEVQKSAAAAPSSQLQRCNTSKSTENTEGREAGDSSHGHN
ncbi:hypothetical protein B296_00007914 [Ensete ventricosum]|uniref:Uncharacterized protein n=1 Tax=Ensete ventricosum TaxID=4639 RepID=A0A427BAG5_ENSVE|nr:hypothetical protein B296_00007914 [Ensete ventricosum]